MHPITLVAEYPERMSRLTAFFRGILVIPHLIWLMLWSILAALLGFVSWIVVTITGHQPEGIANMLDGYLRYSTHVSAYAYLMSGPFPAFTGSAAYPTTEEIVHPDRQGRLAAFFRLLLVIPAAILSSLISYATQLCAFIQWIVIVITAKPIRGLWDFQILGLRYATRVNAYSFYLTDRYPNFSTEAPPVEAAAS